MPDDLNEPDAESATAHQDVVVWRGWRDGKPMIAVREEDGAIRLHDLKIVPDAVWNLPISRVCSLPDWANHIDDPTQQFLVLVTVLGNRTLEATDELNAIRIKIKTTRALIAEGVSQKLIEKRLADLLDMVNAVTKTLDP